jgi:hypothetical protein
MSQDATRSLAFATALGPLAVDFAGGRLTSDGGLPLLAAVDTELGLCAAFADRIPDWRTGPIRHTLEALVRQRVFQIACGYADQNDATTLRTDPLLKLVCGQHPISGADLASQPTLSRLDNAVDRRTCYALAVALVGVYLAARERDGAPTHLVLDLDSTDDPVYGKQEGGAYHGFYEQRMYHPLLVYDGTTNQLITAVLRPGTVHASRGVITILKRLIPALRARWPGVRIELRADSGFAIPALYTFCEAAAVDFTIGLIPNARLEALAAPLLAEATERRDAAGEKVRLAAETAYQAGSWDRERRVVYKAEALEKGPNTRFVVTTKTEEPLAVYNWYVDRGEPENWIKDFKCGCFADRLSCSHFWANQFRLLLHAAAYWLLDTLRRWLLRAGAARTYLETVRLRVVKIAGWLIAQRHGFLLRLASSHPGEQWWPPLVHLTTQARE